MAITVGQGAVNSWYRPQNTMYALNSGEASSGEVFINLFATDQLPTPDVGIHAAVRSIGGVPRTLTKINYIAASGIVDITGSSFAYGDLVTIYSFKYWA